MIRGTFLEALRRLLGPAPGMAVMHSSLADLCPPLPFTRWDFLHGFARLVEEGWTVALPAFTFSFCGAKRYHHIESPSETGVLADWLLEDFPGARRTHHPIYSFAVAGPQTERILALDSPTTFGDGSPFGFFEQENAVLVMLGCGWSYATQFHRYEELAGVEYRYFKDFSAMADLGDGFGEHPVVARMFVRDLDLDPRNDFTPAVDRLRRDGLITSVALWRGRAESARVADVAGVCRAMLADDPLAFVEDAPATAQAMANIRRSRQTPALRVAVLGSSNVHLLCRELSRELSELLPDRAHEIVEVPFGQMNQAILDPGSTLNRSKTDITFFCDRLEDLLGQGRLDEPDDGAAALVEDYAALVARHHAHSSGWTFVHRFAPLRRSVGNAEALSGHSLSEAMNRLLSERLADMKRLSWIDVGAEAAQSDSAAVDIRLWHLGRFPYSERFSGVIARLWAGKILATLGKTARALVLDLDQTLWGGVLGEDGIQGLSLGGDYPGNAFLAFQDMLVSLSRRGLALAVCSKNDEDLALRAMEDLPHMRIRPAALAAHRINWNPKWANIRELAEELNLGLESILFIDDNPVERASVRKNLPGVKVLELPADPTGYGPALLDSPWLGVAEITPEDRQRTRSYAARRQIERLRTETAGIEEFYESLKMTLHLEPLSMTNLARAEQLCMKTNQFNTTTRRHTRTDLQDIVTEGGEVVVLGLEDRFSPRENIGLIILRPAAADDQALLIDSYLLSCRVLGRGIETVVLQWAQDRAFRLGHESLLGLVEETPRNTPARGVFQAAGFQAGPVAGQWTVSAKPGFDPPSWLKVLDTCPPPSRSTNGAAEWMHQNSL